MKKKRFLIGPIGGLIAVCALFTACPDGETGQDDAGLKELWINGQRIQLPPEEYTVYEGRVLVRAVPSDSGAAVAVFPAQANADAAGLAIAVGSTEAVRVRVTARDQVTVKDYAVTVKRGAGSINLKSLWASRGALTPEFYPERTEYTLQAPNNAASIVITAKKEGRDANVVVKSDGQTITPNIDIDNDTVSFEAAAAKQVKVTVKLDSANVEKTYTIDITRAANTSNSIEGTFGIEDTIQDAGSGIVLSPPPADPAGYHTGEILTASFTVDRNAGWTGYNWYRGSGGSLGPGVLNNAGDTLTLCIYIGEEAEYEDTSLVRPDHFFPLEPGKYNLTLRFEQIQSGERPVFYSQTVSFWVVE